MISMGTDFSSSGMDQQKTSGVVNLSKGGRVNLSKSKPGLKHIMIGLGWDIAKYSNQDAFDLDASVFMVNAMGRTPEEGFIFYNRRSDKGNYSGNTWVVDEANSSVIHTGDNRTGGGDGDDEQIFVDLDKIPAWCEKLAITVTIDQAERKGQSFGMVENAFCRLVNNDTGEEEVRFDLGEDFCSETAVVIGEIYRKDGDWRFVAVGQGFNKGLEGLVNNYGLQAVYQ